MSSTEQADNPPPPDRTEGKVLRGDEVLCRRHAAFHTLG